MNINIRTIPHSEQRYPTCGDWLWVEDERTLVIHVSDTGRWQMNLLVAFHELAEAALCKARMIPQEDVDRFDIIFDGEGEPGDAEDCPYRAEHFFATTVERLLAAELGVDWQEYEKVLCAL